MIVNKIELIENQKKIIEEYMLKRVAEEHEKHPDIDFFYAMEDFLRSISTTLKILTK